MLIEAVNWWKMHRPVGWSEAQHLENPTINSGDSTVGGCNSALCRAVAALVKETAQVDDATPLVQMLYDLAQGKTTVNRSLVLRQAEAFLGKREVEDDTKPLDRGRKKVLRRGVTLR